MACATCGTPNPATARFCLGCGCQLMPGFVCTTCFTLLPGYARFCFHCGAMVIAAHGALGQALPQTQAPPPLMAPTPTHFQQPAAPPQPPRVAPQPFQQPPAAQPAAVPSPAPQAAPTVPGGGSNGLPEPRPLAELLPALERYLPRSLFEPLERRPNERQIGQARDHLTALLRAAKTYLPRPVVMAPQPAGQPAGGMARGTFLFVDVSGFTPLSERLSRFGRAGAERVTEIMNGLFYDLVKVLFDHGGTLLKFGGDALLGLFPGDDEAMYATGALRAVQAALAMQAVMEKYGAIEAGGETRALRIKCGISSGDYFAAHIGTKQNMAFVTTGHTVNRADQAEGNATPGEVVIAQATLDLLDGQAVVEPRAEGFFVVHGAPEATDVESSAPPDEPPPGPLQAQLTYLVERLDRLAPYLAAELLPRIVNNPHNAQIAPDHRPVTVVFANYVGISDLIADLGERQPELITHHLNNYFVHMAEVVERYEGAVARMDQYSVGDRLVVFFGAPRAHEDDPVRAVYTALDMQEATRKHFSALQTAEGIYRFRQRVGINTGHLFAGNVGAANLRQEYTLMGDDINMAARLMSKAGWRQIFVSQKTQERVAPFFDLKDEGELKVKGKEILIRTYQVLGRRGEIGRTRGLDTGESPLIGRDGDLEGLMRCARLFLSGRGQIVSIIGNSGLGKSRITRELKQGLLAEAGDRPLRWLEGQALSFSEQVSYWVAVQIIRGALDLKPDASDDDLLFTLWEQAEGLLGKETAREAVPFLAYLLGLTLEGEWAQWVAELDPQVRQKQTFWAAREFFTAFAQRQPTVIALDDLHWADEASLALLEDLLAVTDRAPLMFCLIFREVREKGSWRLRDRADRSFPHRYHETTLRPLTTDQSRDLLGRLLPGAAFSEESIREILVKSAGNPFYLEEVVRSLIESGSVAPDAAQPERWTVTSRLGQIAVPDSLQGAIVARIDRLTEDVRQALQMASVIGRRFQKEVFTQLVQESDEPEYWLAQLERTGFVRADAESTGALFAFPDALVQEVAYESLLVQRRQRFHEQVGETLEALLGEQAAEECERLAFHFSRSDNDEKARKYLELAGQKAEAGFANATALQHYTDLLARLEASGAGWEERFEMLSRRQKILSLLGRQGEREADLRAMLALAEAHDDAGRIADARIGLADLFQWTGRYADAESTAREALAAKEALADEAGQAAALHQIGVVNYVRGNYAEARPPLEKAIALRQALHDAEGQAWSQMYLCMFYFVHGNYDEAEGHNGEALASARQRQDWFQMGIHLTNAARISVRLGEYEQALEQFEQSLEMKTRVGDRMGQGFTHFGIGQVHTALGDYERAAAALGASLALRREINDERGIGQCLHGLGQVALRRGDYARAVEHFTEAYDLRTRLGLKSEPIADLSFLGQAHLGAGDLEQALAVSSEAVARLREHAAVEEHQAIHFNHYRVLAALDDPGAREALQRAAESVRAQAAQIADPAKRETFLRCVRVNQEISAAVGIDD